MLKKAVITVTGKVQGVYYRTWAKAQADELGLSGFARNEADGSVRVVVEGEEADINEYITRCRYGSDSAEVTNVRVEWSEADGNLADFSIQ